MNAVSKIIRASTAVIFAVTLAIAPLDGASGARSGNGGNGNSGNSGGGGNGGSSGGGGKNAGQRGNSGEAKSRAGRTPVPKRYPESKRAQKPPTEKPPKKYPPRDPKPPKYPPKPPKYPPREPPVVEKPPRKPPYRRPPIIVTTPLPTPVNPAPSFVPPRGPSSPPPRIVTPRPPSTVPPVAQLNRSRDREIIIAMDDTTSDGDTITLGQGLTLNVEVQYRSSLLALKIVRLRIPDNRSLTQVLEQVIQAGTTDPRIVAVQPNYVFQTTQSSTAAAIRPLPQYAVDKVRLGEAHRAALGRDVRIAVIDTGLDSTHPDLQGAVSDTFDAIGEGPVDVEAHGTAIAGIVGARHQLRGTAPDSRVLAVRAFAKAESANPPKSTTLALIKALDWAVTNSARVVNMSFAGPQDPLLQRAIEEADKRGLVLVAAAGNEGPKAGSAYPAAFPQVIAVTASDSDDQVYDQANQGTYIAIAAPGVDIIAPAPSSGYEMSSGTSLAAAHVSGIIALILERNPAMTSEQVRALLTRTARDPDRNAAKRGLGAGIVDAARAVSEAK